MKEISLYRKRLIPEECILLKDDHLLYHDSEVLITSWNTLKPKSWLHHGFSCYYLNDGIKISKFYNADGQFLYWYCDIISHFYDNYSNSYYFTDLLADVIIHPDGSYEVLDLDELAIALSTNLLSVESACDALNKLDYLLRLISDQKIHARLADIDQKIAPYYT